MAMNDSPNPATSGAPVGATAPGQLRSGATGPRRLLVGTNVLIATALVFGIVGFTQWFAHKAGARWDWTSTGVNSLSDGTVRLLQHLDKPIRLTSLYFQTDIEEEDQQRYRRAIDDLLGLYQSTQRTHVATEWINPLREHEKKQKLVARLREKTVFKDGVEAYQRHLERFKTEFDKKIRELIQSELDMVGAAGGAMADKSVQSAVAPVENLLSRLLREVSASADRIAGLTAADTAQFAGAVEELKNTYRLVSKAFNDIGKYGREQTTKTPNLPESASTFLGSAATRYAPLVGTLEEESNQLQALEPLKLDDIIAQLTPNGNALLVESDDDVRVVDFSSVWPPLDERAGVRAPFHQRAFKGEEKLTSAILRVTHKEQTAVVFVKYGGPPLFFGGFMPNQPSAPYATMKLQLEDANFIVEEWDLKAKDTPPDIDPPPTRTIYVILKPMPPERGPMGQPGQDPPFGPSQLAALTKAIGENGRALFIAGWSPGPFGPIPATYEFNEYLKEKWGFSIDSSFLLIETMSIKPGQYQVARRDFMNMDDLEVTGHDIVSGAHAHRLSMPWASPLQLPPAPPAGVEWHKLVIQPKRDGVWGIQNIQTYEEQLQTRQYLTLAQDDREGPFDLAVAAHKGNEKVVVVSAREFAVDDVAFARGMSMTAEGFSLHARNPGNVTLLINSLHWLNDNADFMNIGKPIDAAVLEIKNSSTVTKVKALTIFFWPVLALIGGGVAWWIRRR